MMVILGYAVMIVEAFIEVGVLIKDKKADVKNYIAFVVGGLVFYLFGIDLVAYLGLEYFAGAPVWLMDWFPVLLGAVLSFRYAGALNDILEWVNKKRFG